MSGESGRRVFDIAFTPLSEAELLRRIVTEPVPPGSGPRTVLTANLDHVVRLRRNPEFRTCYDRAWAATADGMPVYAYTRLRGCPLPERVTGADLFAGLMEGLDPSRHRLFLVANSEPTGQAVIDRLAKRGFPPERLAMVVPPHGFERDAAHSAALADAIAEHRPTHVVFGVGAPKSEIWAERHRDRIGDAYVLCVGAGLDFYVGARQRAPAWIQRSGFEWAWRFSQEPQRLFRRYFVDSWGFLAAIGEDLAGGRR